MDASQLNLQGHMWRQTVNSIATKVARYSGGPSYHQHHICYSYSLEKILDRLQVIKACLHLFNILLISTKTWYTLLPIININY